MLCIASGPRAVKREPDGWTLRHGASMRVARRYAPAISAWRDAVCSRGFS